MKKILSLFMSCLLIVGVSTMKVSAHETGEFTEPSEHNVVNLDDVLANPEKYPNIEINIVDTKEYIDIIRNSNTINPETKNELIDNAITSSLTRGVVYEYLTLKDTAKIDYGYSCYPYFFCKMEYNSGFSTPNRIVSVEYADINLDYYGISKVFAGNLHYILKAGNRLYWDLNGHYYNNGDISISYGGSIGITGAASTSFTVGYSSSHYAYKQVTGEYYSSTMQP